MLSDGRLLGYGWDNEHSFYLRHEGHEMKLKFMTPRQAKKDQHTLKEKIEKERIEKEEI